MGMAAMLVMWPRQFEQLFVSHTSGEYIWNLVTTGPVVLEEKLFEIVNRRWLTTGPSLPISSSAAFGSGELKFGVDTVRSFYTIFQESRPLWLICRHVILGDQMDAQINSGICETKHIRYLVVLENHKVTIWWLAWMNDLQFYSFSTIFQSYQDVVWMIMKGCVQIPFMFEKILALSGYQTQDG